MDMSANTPRDGHQMTLADLKEELILGWIAQAHFYPELTGADMLDAAQDLQTRIETDMPDVPVFMRARGTTDAV